MLQLRLAEDSTFDIVAQAIDLHFLIGRISKYEVFLVLYYTFIGLEKPRSLVLSAPNVVTKPIEQMCDVFVERVMLEISSSVYQLFQVGREFLNHLSNSIGQLDDVIVLENNPLAIRNLSETETSKDSANCEVCRAVAKLRPEGAIESR